MSFACHLGHGTEQIGADPLDALGGAQFVDCWLATSSGIFLGWESGGRRPTVELVFDVAGVANYGKFVVDRMEGLENSLGVFREEVFEVGVRLRKVVCDDCSSMTCVSVRCSLQEEEVELLLLGASLFVIMYSLSPSLSTMPNSAPNSLTIFLHSSLPSTFFRSRCPFESRGTLSRSQTQRRFERPVSFEVVRDRKRPSLVRLAPHM